MRFAMLSEGGKRRLVVVDDGERIASLGPIGAELDSLFDPAGLAKAKDASAGLRDLRIACRLNGQTLQDANTSDMIFPVAGAIATISEFMTLGPGDMIAMGVGHARKPPSWMKAGDTVEIEIEKIGILRNPVEAGSAV